MQMLVDLPREAILRPGFWKVSPAVPVRKRPERPVVERTAGGDLADLWSALDAIPNGLDGKPDLGYDTWRDVIYGVHFETGGSDEGLARVEEWSSRSPKYVAGYAEEKVWNYADGQRPGGITGATVFHHAAQWGWVNPRHVVPDASAFSVVPAGGGQGDADASEVVDDGDVDLPAFDREKTGVVKPTVENAVRAVRRADLCGMRIAHDEFRDEITVGAPGVADGWRPMTDADLVRLRIHLERLRFKSAPKELARDAAVLVAEENRYDSAQVWLAGVEGRWDGLARCETFLRDFFGCEDTPYTRAVSLYIWTALAGRVIEPGCQADMAPVLEGDQGLRKTSAIAALAPAPEFFVEIDFSKDETETARLLRGVLVAEISELRGLHTRDQESIKAFVSRRHEKWTPKYKEFATTFARRAVLFGSTNRTDILADETGNRRWLPVHVDRADVEGIAAARDQLWAEGAALFRSGRVAGPGGAGGGAAGGRRGGVAWEAAERLGAPEHEKYMLEDAWAGPVAAWLGAVDGFGVADPVTGVVGTRGEGLFTVAELMSGALGLSAKDMNMQALKRVGAVLRSLGYERTFQRIEGRPVKCWRRV